MPAAPIRIPLTHPPFPLQTPNQPPLKNSYNVALQISPGQAQTSPQHVCQVDTGSCGIVIPQSLLYINGQLDQGLLPGVTLGEPISVTYEPSGNQLLGFTYLVEKLAIGIDLTGAPAFIAENVVVVGSTNAAPGEGMMGVGFGRPTQLGTNVFLNAPGLNPSYLLTTDSIWLGYTPATLPDAASFRFQTLASGTPAATITITPPLSAGAPVSYAGNALLDTGVNLMMLGLPQAGWEQTLVGSQITIAWPGTGSDAPLLSYTFTVTEKVPMPTQDPSAQAWTYTVGGSTPMLPASLVPIGLKTPAFVNTGINVIRGAAFFYDQTSNQIGFSSAN